jgi:hypothetical protein
MEWYIPITILPGIGLLILSTSNFVINLNTEIRELEEEKNMYSQTIIKKLSQLRVLTYALIGEYITSFFLVVGGFVGGLMKNDLLINLFVFIGVIFLCISIALLIYYSIKSLQVRQEHLKL